MDNRKTVFGIIQGINEKDKTCLNGFIDDCLRRDRQIKQSYANIQKCRQELQLGAAIESLKNVIEECKAREVSRRIS